MNKANHLSYQGILDGDPSYRGDVLAAELQIEVAIELNRALESFSLSRTDLARKYGCTAPWITKALSGNQDMRLSSVARLASALDCRAKMIIQPLTLPAGQVKGADNL